MYDKVGHQKNFSPAAGLLHNIRPISNVVPNHNHKFPRESDSPLLNAKKSLYMNIISSS